MNSIQRSSLIQLIKQHFPYTEPCDVDHALQWEIIAETLNALGPPQTIDQWIEDWETIKNNAIEKSKAIKSKQSEFLEIPEELQLTEEDHRVIKICNFSTDSKKMEKLMKMLDCRAVSPFENYDSEESDVSDYEDDRTGPVQKATVKESVKDINDVIAERNIAIEQLEEQKKINVQLAELLAIFKTPSQTSCAN
ncbi:uncharacterized protein LOC129941195 [Eupeodes corollae]|uniref:uncharacterized protein LOC129941195 n=1 Tax=Eupeodes corollae TaxID=290404 RepID=UPI00248FBBA6|nr:uncharacterized protein LOC129941195 [Eupeodes corollae]